jgi:hypothetical protein
MLAEVGAHPELANLLETPRVGRGSVKPSARKSRSPQVAVPQETLGKDIHISRLLRISPQQLGSN